MKNKKKILYVITKSNWGGAQRYVYDLATNLPRKEFDICVVLGGEGELVTRLKEAAIRTVAIKKLRRDIGIINDIASLVSFVNIFLKEKPDVVHLNSSKAGGLGALAGRIAGVKKIIFTAHGWAFNEERGRFSKTAIWLLSWITALLCHRVITVSDYDLTRARQMPFIRKKLVRIHNGIKNIKFISKKESRASLLPDHTPAMDKMLWIGMIAEFHANKGIEYAIKAIKLLEKKSVGEELVLTIIGEGEERIKLQNLIENLHLEDRIFLAGKKEDASTFLKAFDIFILSSIKEGLPYVILEAGLAGLPVVAAAVGGVSEIITDMHSGILVKPKYEDEIALALEFLVTNSHKRDEFGTALKDRVMGDFSLKTLVSQTSTLYMSDNDNAGNAR